MKGWRVASWLVVSALAAALAASAQAPDWRLADRDYDGDARPDRATLELLEPLRGGVEYRFELTLFGGTKTQQFSIPSGAGDVRLQLRDVDGDNDPDIVFRDPFNRVVALLLNGGNGVFTQATDLDSYRLNPPLSGASVCAVRTAGRTLPFLAAAAVGALSVPQMGQFLSGPAALVPASIDPHQKLMAITAPSRAPPSFLA